MDDKKVVRLPIKNKAINELEAEIDAAIERVIEKYDYTISYSEILGTLEVMKQKIFLTAYTEGE